MDWYLSDGASGVHHLRRQIRDYLRRHAEPGSAVEDAHLVVSELLANAVEHAAGPVWVRLSWHAEEPDVEVWDLGPGFTLPASGGPPAVPVERLDESPQAPAPYPERLPDLAEEGGRGVFLVTHLAPVFEAQARRGGGTHVSARLPVRRAPSPSFAAPQLTPDALPTLDEADAEGRFGRESFLRALVVQLSQAVEDSAGPHVIEEVVSQVGTAVGGQMETAFRLARQLTERLTPQELAECYVHLKHAIDGRFYVVEVTDDRIVLGNHRCPFGNAVRSAPALCRMTSSVFGGIAARNHDDGAAVVLEERIAVGDPGCRVVVHLGTPPAEAARFAHRYGGAASGRQPESVDR